MDEKCCQSSHQESSHQESCGSHESKTKSKEEEKGSCHSSPKEEKSSCCGD